jgi:hypothetical protein
MMIIGPIIYGACANLCFTLGWIVDTSLYRGCPRNRLWKAGLIFSLVLTRCLASGLSLPGASHSTQARSLTDLPPGAHREPGNLTENPTFQATSLRFP